MHTSGSKTLISLYTYIRYDFNNVTEKADERGEEDEYEEGEEAVAVAVAVHTTEVGFV